MSPNRILQIFFLFAILSADLALAQTQDRACNCAVDLCKSLISKTEIDGLLVNKGGVFYIALDQSTCFKAFKGSEDASIDSGPITRMHVAPSMTDKDGRPDISSLSKAVGARVRLTGHPEYATTAHHLTPVVLFTTKVIIRP